MTALMLSALVPSIALAAASSFTGGPDQWPVYLSNDHTPIAVHFTADASAGLAPSTTYFVKVRYTVGTTPSGSTNRGYTWNPTTSAWAQERDEWTFFPTVTTDASGTIGSSAGWVFTKFGDETKKGPYHLMVSLSATGSGATFNATILPIVTVLDSRTEASSVHNGVASGIQASKRAAVTLDASTTVLSLSKTEAQLVDDDANTVVDDENWGPAGATGDFHMSVPVSTTIGINLNQIPWSPATGFVSGPADVNLAIGAADTIAPTAPGGLVGQSGDTTASLEWTAAADNSAVAGYYVYRWSTVPAGAAYSAVASRVATLAAGETSYQDSALTNGLTYVYEVRAFDAATNVGPRSSATTVTPNVARPNATVTPSQPDGDMGWYLTVPSVELTTGPGLTSLYAFSATPSVWTPYTAPIVIPVGVSTLTYRHTDGVTMGATGTLPFKVDTSAPSATMSAPAMTVPTSKSTSFKISWNGTDVGSGIAGYHVQYRTSATGTWKDRFLSTSTKSTTLVGAVPGANYYFRVRATDVAGNEGAWSTVRQTVVPYDQGRLRVSANWKTVAGSFYYLGSSRYATTKGASATLSFTRGTVYLVAKTSPKLGKIAVYYRGRRVGTVDLHSNTTKYRQVFRIASSSTATTPGTVKLVNLGTKDHARIEVDGFAIKR